MPGMAVHGVALVALLSLPWALSPPGQILAPGAFPPACSQDWGVAEQGEAVPVLRGGSEPVSASPRTGLKTKIWAQGPWLMCLCWGAIKSTSPWHPSSFQLKETIPTIYLAALTIACSSSKTTWLPGILQDKFFTTLCFFLHCCLQRLKKLLLLQRLRLVLLHSFVPWITGYTLYFTCHFEKNQFQSGRAQTGVAEDQCTFPGAAGHWHLDVDSTKHDIGMVQNCLLLC